MDESSQSKIIVGMPAYNEAKYIGSLVLQSQQYADEVLVVDDGSTDYTARIAELAGATVVRHMENKGYGSAIQSILAEAKKRNADILVILDADSQHNPEEIPSLVKAISEGSDVVIGSREMQRNTIASYRRLGQRILSRLTYIASRKKLSDTESGFRAYSRKAIATLELKEKGMAISSEIVSEASAKGLKVTEVPISVIYTEDGSTLNPIRHGFGVLNRIMVMISERRPLLFFGLLGGMFLVLGLVAGLVVIQAYYFSSRVLATGTALISILLVTIGLLSIFTGIILNVLVKRIGDQL
jgi:glycosyltransferase involved in cell wall biosynthesis